MASSCSIGWRLTSGGRRWPRCATSATRSSALRLAFLGTPASAAVVLQALFDAGHHVDMVVTRADARRSRRAPPEPSAVKALAQGRGVPVRHDPQHALGAGAELGVVVAYGRIIRPPLLGSMPLVNVHFSLLPRWRGAAPVERAILAGDAVTGVCLMELEAGLDTGAVYARRETAIGDHETAGELTERLAHLGAGLLVETLVSGWATAIPQIGEPTYAAKLTPEDRELAWSGDATALERTVRVGRAWTTWRGKRLLVVGARASSETAGAEPGVLRGDVVATGTGALRLVRVQPEGRPVMDAGEWVRGARPQPGERLGSPGPPPGDG